MKVAYVCYLTGWHRDGVVDKIGAALDEWAAVGHSPTLFLLNPASPTGEQHPLQGQVFNFRTPLERIQATRRLYAAVRKSRPDVVYFRYDLFLPPPSALTRIAPTVVEFNSNSQKEWGNRSRAAKLYGKLQERLLVRRISGAVCVAHELGASVRGKRAGLPVRVIGNGIAISKLPDNLPAPETEGIRVAYLGDDVYWQGIDKVFELAAALPDWQFDLVGVPVERSQGNVTCHGYLGPEQYEPILGRADLALGTLALIRRGMDETSTLKVPRYLAYGLPVIIGYEETDFVGEDPWYLLRLPNTESNVREGIEQIKAFAAAVKGRRVDRAEVAARFSTEVKEAARLAFLAEFATTP